MERRDFLKASALARPPRSLVAACSRRFRRARPATQAVDPAWPPAWGDVTWGKAPCRFCGTGCTVQVGVRGGRVVAIAGDQLAPVNRGLLCVKGYHVGLALYGSDRLTRPMLKRNGRHVPISWEEAVDIIARA
jgi:nitrate reductase NapA